MMRIYAFALACVMVVAGINPATAQTREQTLADIRQELSVLFVEVQRLKRELSTTGAPQVNTGGGDVLRRMEAIEAELVRLTARSEDLELRINAVVRDGTRRIGDLEFRLVELEGGDVSQLGETTTLGGVEVSGGGGAVTSGGGSSGSTGGVELAVGEQADFDRAKAAYEAGDYVSAAAQFATFTQTYTGGPLSPDAHYWRGEALAGQEAWSDAARAYLESFSGSPDSAIAPRALYRLGVSLNQIGQREEACLTLGEVGTRYPDSDASLEAAAAMRSLTCN